MKKFISMAVLVVMLLCPFGVRADLGMLSADVYAESAAIDSNIIMIIGKSQEGPVSGTLNFDSNVLTLEDAAVVPASPFNDLYQGVALNKTVNNGTATITAENSGADYVIQLTFKIKKAPSNGSTTLKFTPANNTWGGANGAVSATIKIGKEKECPTCPTCSKDEVTCPVCETCQECESCDNNASDSNVNQKEEKETSNNNNMALYVSLGACAVLAVSVIVLAVKKS